MTTLQLAAIGSVEPDVLLKAGAVLTGGLGGAVDQIGALEMPGDAYDPVRRQYSAVALLRAAANAHSAQPTRLIAMTEADLSIPMLTFVFGQAQLGGRVAVVSLARLRPEFYGLRPDNALFYQRLTKELLHESGHLFGLVHCSNRRCPMSLSTSILEVDVKSDSYCPSCAALLAGSISPSGGARSTTEKSP